MVSEIKHEDRLKKDTICSLCIYFMHLVKTAHKSCINVSFIVTVNKMLMLKNSDFCLTCHRLQYLQRWAIIYNILKGSTQTSTLGQRSTPLHCTYWCPPTLATVTSSTLNTRTSPAPVAYLFR